MEKRGEINSKLYKNLQKKNCDFFCFMVRARKINE